MPPSAADSESIAIIRRLAEEGQFAMVASQVQSDLMAHGLRTGDIADAIVEWIAAGERVKPTILHSFSGRAGEPAYELKPRLNESLWYIKVCIDDRGGPAEGLVLLSAHPDH